jgi:hypothetical protein
LAFFSGAGLAEVGSVPLIFAHRALAAAANTPARWWHKPAPLGDGNWVGL